VEQGDRIYTRPVLDVVAKRDISVPPLAEELERLILNPDLTQQSIALQKGLTTDEEIRKPFMEQHRK
jgi:hypothetical protein